MKQNSTLAVASLMTLFVMAGPVVAASNTGSTPGTTSNTTTAPSASTVSGTVQNVDKTNNSIQVKNSTGSLQMVKVDAGTQISRSGKSVQLSDLNIGDLVSIQTSNTNNGTM